MIQYCVKVKIVGSGGFCLKKNTRIPTVKWKCYMIGGERNLTGDDRYLFKAPRCPHFLFWYYKKYHVEYSVMCSRSSFAWEYFHGLKDLHIHDGDIVIDEIYNEKYIMVQNPTTLQIEPYKILGESR